MLASTLWVYRTRPKKISPEPEKFGDSPRIADLRGWRLPTPGPARLPR